MPFATPGTPFLQDLVHLCVVCTLLYFAPQIQNYFKKHRHHDATTVPNLHEPIEVHQEATQQAPVAPDALPNAEPPPERESIPAPVPAVAPPPPRAAPHDNADDPIPGPADGPAPTARNRTVGTKKAASLARRDQRRAYNEFLRSQGDAARAAEAEGAAERAAALAAEKARRDVVEAELREREREVREARRVEEERERELEKRTRDEGLKRVAEALGRTGWVDLTIVATKLRRETAWLEKLVRAGGLLKEASDEVVFVTEAKVLVRVSRADLEECWRLLDMRVNAGGEGRVEYEEVGKMLESVVKSRTSIRV